MLHLSTKKNSLKSDTERGKYTRFSRLFPFFACLLPRLNAGVKLQSILWCAWPPLGRSSTLKIACGSNIDDIRGNTTFIANCLYFFKKSITSNSLKFCFDGGGLCFSSPQKKFIKIRHRTWKIRSF